MRGAFTSFGIKALVMIGSVILSIIIVYHAFKAFFPGGMDALAMTVIYGLFPVIVLSVVIASIVQWLMDKVEADRTVDQVEEDDVELRREYTGPDSIQENIDLIHYSSGGTPPSTGPRSLEGGYDPRMEGRRR
jgi:amino acid permease